MQSGGTSCEFEKFKECPLQHTPWDRLTLCKIVMFYIFVWVEKYFISLNKMTRLRTDLPEDFVGSNVYADLHGRGGRSQLRHVDDGRWSICWRSHLQLQVLYDDDEQKNWIKNKCVVYES